MILGERKDALQSAAPSLKWQTSSEPSSGLHSMLISSRVAPVLSKNTRAGPCKGWGEEQATLGSSTEKQLTPHCQALQADQRTHEFHMALIPLSFSLFVQVSKSKERVEGLGLMLQSQMRTGGAEQLSSAQKTRCFCQLPSCQLQ